jgi:tRNA(Ile)-lysidine synthase
MSACSRMAGSPIPNSADIVAVAYSAGRDSTALLYAALRAAQREGYHVLALHVHHGLSPQADAWLRHAQQQCQQWALQGYPVRFVSHREVTQPVSGESIEAWARRIRYAALARMALQHGADLILLGHHQRDQAETFLLQALRGGGLAGLASMPQSAQRAGITWLRPWLHRSRSDIDAYVAEHALAHIDDESNDNPRFDRNRLRHHIFPALTAAFPQAQTALAMAAQWAQEALVCAQELAEIDLPTLTDGPHLHVARWQLLSSARRSNALRAWLTARTAAAPAASLVQRLMRELGGSGVATWPLPHGSLKRYRGQLSVHTDAAMASACAPAVAPETTLSITRAGRYALPGWGGQLCAQRVREGGVPLAWLGHLELRPRTGGEQFQSGLGRPPRSLKKQYQAAQLPAWERAGPLVYSGGQLIFVPGLGADARMLAVPGQAQMHLTWQAETAA